MAKDRKGSKDKEGDTYEFPMPKFDERGFMRREIEGAKMSFVTVGLGLLAGVLARLVAEVAPDWKFGWLPILLLVAGLGPLFRRMGYTEDNTKPRAMFGNWSLLFFTGLALWVLLYNPPFDQWL